MDLTTVTGCINAGNFSQAISVAGVTMPGNQPIQDALTDCQVKAKALADAQALALSIADGN